MGKQAKDQTKDRAISIRLSNAMLDALDEYAQVEDKDRTQIIREAIAQYLGLSIDPTEERFTALEDRMDSLDERLQELANQISRCVEFWTQPPSQGANRTRE